MEVTRPRKAASAEQLAGLLEFMKEHVELAKGHGARSIHGRMVSKKLWSQCAAKLNSMKGSNRNIAGWAKYWNDWKSRVRKKALSIQLATKLNTSMTDSTPLTAHDLEILNLIGKPDENVVIRRAFGGESDEEGDQNDNVDESANEVYGESSVEIEILPDVVSRKRRRSSVETSQLEQTGPSTSKRLAKDVTYFNVDTYDYKTRKMISIDQLIGLVQFIQEHPQLAQLGHGSRDTIRMANIRKLWKQCADKLNAIPGNPRTAKGWSKYWSDWKARLRQKVMGKKTIKSAAQCTPLNELEEVVLDLIMPRDSSEGDDPLAVEVLEEVEDDIDNNEEEPSRNQDYGQSSRTKRPDQSVQMDDDSSLEAPGMDHRGSPVDTKPVQIDVVDSDGQINVTSEEAAEFLRLERDKLQNSERLINAVLGVKSEVSKLTDVLTQIKDIIANKL